MNLLQISIRHADGRTEQLGIDAESVLIGSGGHCDIRLPVDQAAVEHVVVQVGPAGVLARSRVVEPLPTVNDVPFSQTLLLPESVLGIRQTQMRLAVSVAEAGSATVTGRKKEKTSPLAYIGLALLLPALYYVMSIDNDDGGVAPANAAAPALWAPGPVACRTSGSLAQLREAGATLRAQADQMRERRPFSVQAGVQAVPTYREAAACLRAAGETAGAEDATAAGNELSARVKSEYETHQLALDYQLSRRHWARVQGETETLVAFTQGKSGPYVEWLASLERRLQLQLGKK